MRSYALEDPRGFLDEYKDGAIIDEVQHAPDLLSWKQCGKGIIQEFMIERSPHNAG